MRSALEGVEGAKVVDIGPIDSSSKSAKVCVEGSADTTALVAALKKAGYGATVEDQ